MAVGIPNKCALALFFNFSFLIFNSPAAEAPRTLSVTGAGLAQGRPTELEIAACVSGRAELAADALVKYRDARRRALKSLEDLQIPRLSVRGLGPAFAGISPEAIQQAMNGADPADIKAQVHVVEQLRISLAGIDQLADAALHETLARILDAAKDAGLQLLSGDGNADYYAAGACFALAAEDGGETTRAVSYVLPDASALRKRAVERAVEDAGDRARHLAALTKVKLGRLHSVIETSPAGNVPSDAPDAVPPRLSAATRDGARIRAEVRVEYEIEQ